MQGQEIFTIQDSNTDRLDKLLTTRFNHYSRSYFQRLIKNGYVLINDKTAKNRDIPIEGDTVKLTLPALPTLKAHPETDIPIHFLFEDEHILAVNKAPGLVVHPAPGHFTGTIANAVMNHLQNYIDPIRPGIIHRLDKDTSGVLLVAKNEQSHEKFAKLFADRLIEKRYLALCWGNPGERIINLPLGRHTKNRQKMAVRADGKQAITIVKPLATNGELTLLDIQIKTGRTHQIRAHLAHVNTPILGDSTYGYTHINERYAVGRQLLHAYTLTFEHPFTHKKQALSAPPPPDMAAFIQSHFPSVTSFL